MKDILQVRSNPVFLPDSTKKGVHLKPMLELIIIHTDGKEYMIKGKGVGSAPKFAETRFFIDADQLKDFQSQLQLVGDQMNRMEVNTMKINKLIQIAEDAQSEIVNHKSEIK